jgi:hypothetical protein
MKLILNIFLIAVLCFYFSTSKRTEETTQEDDGTIKTVITDEWENEERRGNGRGRGRGDTIVVMTNDNENTVHQNTEVDSEVAETRLISIKDISSPLLRFHHASNTDYYYSANPKEQETLENVFYKNDANFGQVITKREDFPECFDLVPLTRSGAESALIHSLIATTVCTWWKHMGVIGYGVLEKGQCGATIAVRQLSKSNCSPCVLSTNSDTEHNNHIALGYTSGGPVEQNAPTFYIWDTAAQFEPSTNLLASKTALLTRFHNATKTDWHYSAAQKEQATLGQAGYTFDGDMGRVVMKQTDMSSCSDLVPITRLSNAQVAAHALIVTASDVAKWKNDGWKVDGVIGYGVLEKGRCGATLAVRQLGVVWGDRKDYFQTSKDVEYNIWKKKTYVDGTAQVFYIWDA